MQCIDYYAVLLNSAVQYTYVKVYWNLNWEQITAGLLLLQLRLLAELI